MDHVKDFQLMQLNYLRKKKYLSYTPRINLRVPFDYQDEGDLKEHYNKKYLLGDSNINSYEAYTEIWAELINCYLISQYVRNNQNNISSSIQ